MATSAFRVYNSAKSHLLTGGLDLDTNILRAALYGGTAASDYTLSVVGSLATQASGGGYATKSLTSVTVGTGTSAKEIKFDAADLSWSANASAIDSIKYLVIFASGTNRLLGWVHLTDTSFSLNAGNKLTITWNASGIFTLTGGTT